MLNLLFSLRLRFCYGVMSVSSCGNTLNPRCVSAVIGVRPGLLVGAKHKRRGHARWGSRSSPVPQRAARSPEAREMSQKALDQGWQDTKRRVQIIRAAGKIKSHAIDDKILAAVDDPDKTVASNAANVAKSLKLQKKSKDSGPLISTLKVEDVVSQVVKTHADASLGEQLFIKQTCVACHTTSQDQPQKGPYLGNIAQTYKRPDLAMNILDPNKTIAQGFTTNVITLKDGNAQMGFVTNESGDKVTIRNIAAQEFTFKKSDIKDRATLPTSIMPPGLVGNLTVKEFASLLDYLEELSKKK